jgi:hypothetical protein
MLAAGAKLGIDDLLAILLGEGAALRLRQDVQHQLRGPAQAGAERGDDDGAVDQHGMRQHRVDQIRVGPGRVVQPQRDEDRLLGTHDAAHAQAGSGDQPEQLLAGGRGLQIFDDLRLGSAVADHRQGVARGAAARLVVARDVAHGCSL